MLGLFYLSLLRSFFDSCFAILDDFLFFYYDYFLLSLTDEFLYFANLLTIEDNKSVLDYLFYFLSSFFTFFAIGYSILFELCLFYFPLLAALLINYFRSKLFTN
jgi:hypothetical protein